MKTIGRLWPLFLLIGLILVADFFGLSRLFHFDTLRQHHREMSDFVSNNGWIAPLAYIGVYITAAVLCLPVAGALSLLGGFLFVQPLGMLYALTGAATGAILLYFVAQTGAGELIKKRASPKLTQMGESISTHTASYLLFLRFIPLFPFWLVNMTPVIFKIPARTYIWTTIIGLIPSSFIYTQVGKGLSTLLQEEGPLTLSSLLSFEIKIALVVLGLVALIPLIIRQRLRRKMNRN